MSKEDILKAYSERLKEIAPLVTAQDRRDACSELNCDIATVSKYFNGKGAKIDFADSLLKFLTGKIEKRKELLNATA